MDSTLIIVVVIAIIIAAVVMLRKKNQEHFVVSTVPYVRQNFRRRSSDSSSPSSSPSTSRTSTRQPKVRPTPIQPVQPSAKPLEPSTQVQPHHGGGKHGNKWKKGYRKGYRDGSYDNSYEGYGYNNRPYGYWRNYIDPVYYDGYLPNYYPSNYYPTAYGLGNPYDYTWNSVYPMGDECYAVISISDAFGPYTAGVMGKQAWLDWAGRNGFTQVYLDKTSVTNDHAVVPYIGNCPNRAQVPPCPRRYAAYPATANYY